MAVTWLLVAVIGFIVNQVSCQFIPFGNPPPLPAQGVRLYQGVLQRTIPNYAMIAARDFSDRDLGIRGLNFTGRLDGINDGLWCQSAVKVNNIGSWQLPNGSVVTDDLEASPLHMTNAPGQVGLLRPDGIGYSPYQGMYTCTIPDENGVNHTLVVWAAGNNAYDGSSAKSVPNPVIGSAPIFNLPIQSRDTDPPYFTLSFNVSVAPPTYVMCLVNSIPVDVGDLFREVTSKQYLPPSTVSPVTSVILTLRTRQPGNYQCTVSVFRASMANTTNALMNATSESVPITVTDTPINFIATRTGLLTVTTSWSAPASNNPPVEGYEVFYESEFGVITSGGNTNSTTASLTLSSLKLNVSYTAFVVAFGGDLPSAHSNTANIPAVITIAVSVQTFPSDVTLYEGTYIDIVCDTNISEAMDMKVDLFFNWMAHDNNGANIDLGGEEYIITNQSSNSTLRIEQLRISRDHMAVYSCSVVVTLSSVSVDIISSESNMDDITLNVIALDPALFSSNVSISGTPTAGEDFTIICIATGPDRLVLTPQLIWEVEIDGMAPLPITMAGANIGTPIIGDTVVSGSATFSKTLKFVSVRTSQAKRYSCRILIPGIVSTTVFEDLHVQIPPPEITFNVDPAVGPIYSSTAVNLTCTAVLAEEVDTTTMAMAMWTGPTGANGVFGQQPTDSSRISVMPAISMGERIFQSILVFYPVDFQEDSGTHTCEMIIKSNTMFINENSFIENGTNIGNILVAVEELPEEVPITSITASGSGKEGQPFNLSCSVTLVERMVVSLGIDYNITWFKVDNVSQGVIGKDMSINTVTIVDDPTTTVTLTFDPLRFGDNGRYFCLVEFNITTTNDAAAKADEVSIIANLNVMVRTEPLNVPSPLIGDTYLDLVCDHDIDMSSGFTVSYTWTGPPNGMEIGGGTQFTVTDQFDKSTLRIEDLNANRDNGAEYTCFVTAVLDGDTLTANDSLTLSVRNINKDIDFTIDVSSPAFPAGIPTAGDNFTATCLGGQPDRIIIDTDLVWEVEIDNMHPAPITTFPEEIVGTYIIGNLVGSGTALLQRTITFVSITTSQSLRYSCSIVVPTLISTAKFFDLPVQISPPVFTFAINPAVDPLYSSTAVNLTCTAVLPVVVDTPTIVTAKWTGPTGTNGVFGEQPTDSSRISVMPAVSVGERTFESILVFYPVDFQEDAGVHTFEMTIISTYMGQKNFIEPVTSEGSTSITVTELPEDFPTITVTASGSGEVGQPFNLSCNVTLVERMVVSPGIDYNITWMKMDSVSQGVIGKDINITTVTAAGDPTTIVTLEFNSTTFGDRGIYVCMADINVTTTFDGAENASDAEIIVEFPPMSVEVSMDYGDPLYAGTNLTLTCSTDLDEDLVDIPIILTTSWTRNSVPVIIDSTHSDEQPSLVHPLLLTYNATYSFTPLDDKFDSTDINDVGDSGIYQCVTTVLADVNDSFTMSRSNSNISDNVNVVALPSPGVNVIVDGTMMIGEPLSLMCVVYAVDRLIAKPMIIWDISAPANGTSVEPSRLDNNSTFSFMSLKSSNAGQYTCRAVVTSASIGVINTSLTGEDNQTITLQIPSLLVNLSQSRDGQVQLAGSNLTLTVDISVDSNVDTPHTVSASWVKNENSLSSNGRVSILNVSNMAGINQYRAQLVFSTLSRTVDSGTYTCMIQVDSDIPYVTSRSTSSSATINVNDPDINLNVDLIEEFAEVQTTCDYSEKFVGLNVTCTGIKSVDILSELRVTMFRDATEIVDSTKHTDSKGAVTVTVTLNSEEDFVDAYYTCQARLLITESPDVNTSTVHQVVFKGSQSRIFQLKIMEFSQCTNPTVQSFLLPLIRSQVTEVIRSKCQCEFQEHLIDQSVLICDELNAVVFKAIVFSSVAHPNVNDLVEFIEEWVQDGPSITIGDDLVMFEPDFPTTDGSLNDVECVEPSSSPPPTTTTMPDTFIAVVAAVVAAAVAALIVISVIIIVCCCRVKRKKMEIVYMSDAVDKHDTSISKEKWKSAEPIKPQEPDDTFKGNIATSNL